MNIKFIRYSKSLFIRLKLHRLFGPLEGLMEVLLYLSRFSRWAGTQSKQVYNDFPGKWDYDKRYPLYHKVLQEHVGNDIPVNYLEFGVADGHSFRWFMQQQQHADSRFYGFDTFDGLPEDWGHYKKGTFGNNKKPPVIDDSRGRFYTGLFQQTLPGFLKDFDASHRNIIMMDADLYSATLFVLTSLAPFLKKGDIIFFDEFVVPTHEFKAFQNFIESYYIDLEWIGAANNYYFAAFKVIR